MRASATPRFGARSRRCSRHDSATTGLRIEDALLSETPAAEPGADAQVGARFGAWRLVRLLGRGGMGDVWLAERADGAYEQRAAIKRVRAGWRPDELIARFRRERQVLARLEHPNIARLLDGGATADGEPYLAMEFVEGEPLNAWCDARRLPVRERLRLFAQVCDAVRFAHANLVIHRDLKPANILVTAAGRPVLLDFGVAKLLDHDEDAALRTRADDRLLTPEYAAPEQLRGGAITTATDVWGLGVLLHELLVGRRPFRPTGTTATEIERLVLEHEPRRPSELADGGDDAAGRAEDAARAAARATTPAALARALRGDLDAIVLNALRKEPARRYHSADQLAEDIDCHLRGLPVQARPDSARYRLGKFARRHRVGVAAGLALALSLLAFGVVATGQARRIALERDRARAEQARSERALSVLVDLFQVSDPRSVPGGDTLRVADLLRMAEQRIDRIEDQPLIRSRLWEAVASIHGSRSELQEQRAALDKALAAAREAHDDDLALRVQGDQAMLSARLEGVDVAEPLLRAWLAANRKRYGPNDEHVAEAMERLGNMSADRGQRLSLLEGALAIRRRLSPGGSIAVASSLSALGGYYAGRGEIATARRYFDQSLVLVQRLLPPDHPDRLLVRKNIAECEALVGHFAESMRMQTELVGIRRRIVGPRTTPVASSLLSIGQNLDELGRPAEAADTLAASHEILVSIFGPDAHSSVGVERYLVVALMRAGRDAEGAAHAEHALHVMAAGRYEASAEDAFLRLRLAAIEAARAHRPDPAALRPWIEVIQRKRPNAHAMIAQSLVELGSAALARPDRALPGEAAAAFARAVAVVDSFVPPSHPLFACAHCGDQLARGAPGGPGDRARLRESLAGCERWGYAPVALVARARASLAAGR